MHNLARSAFLAAAVSAPLLAQPRTIEPATQRFVDAVGASGGPPIHTLAPDAARAVLARAQSGDTPRPEADIEDRVLPVGPGPSNKTRVRIVRPAGSTGRVPALVYAHGGGWVLGDAQTHDLLIRRLAAGARCAVIFVDYDRAPEARFPIALEQVYAVAKHAAEHSDDLNIDANRIAIGGDSAGGQLAAAGAMLAKERGGPRLVAQVLFYPVTDAALDTPSYEEFAAGPWLTKPAMQWFWDSYLPDPGARADPLASPLRAPLDRLQGLPPAVVITAEHDVLRDEGEAYARRLSQAGVRVKSFRAMGTIHDFVMLNALAETPAARASVAMAIEALRTAFYPVDPTMRRAALTEDAKIDRLIEAIARLRGATFVRNGAEHPAAEAADHLRAKRREAGAKITSALDFIESLASRSSVSGEPYLVRLADGTTLRVGDYLRFRLDELEGRQN